MASGDDGGTHVIELGTVGGGSDHGAIAPSGAGGRGGSTPTGGDGAPVAVSASSSATSFDGNGVAHRCGSQSLSAGGAWLRFRDISFGVHTPDGGYKRILDGVSGAAKPGCVLFLMGPSGAGKSSLLDALADRVKLRVTGGVTVDGEPKDELTFKTVAKYVQQDDVLSAALTTHETLLYYARMYCPWDEAEARERARAAMGAMGLDDQADTKIGGLLFRGLSGGQKRRVSVGVQLVARPRIIFLDEPTSGLDSAAALHVVRSLNEVAKTLGTTTVLTIHQPGEKVFDLSNGLLLLSGGRTAYFGLTANAVDHFTGLGHKVPPLTSGAEWMLDLVDTSFQEHETVDEILDAYDSSEAKHLLDAVLSTGKGDAVDTALKESEARGFQAPLWTLLTAGSSSDSSILWQTVVLSRLMLVNVVRNPAYMWLRFAMYIALGIMIGTVWLQIGTQADDIQDIVNVLFFIAAFKVFMSISVLPAYLEDKLIFIRDRANGTYGVAAYNVANAIVSLPFLFLLSLICSSITYWLIGLNSDVNAFFFFVWNLFISFACAEALMFVVASIVPFFVVGIAVGAFIYGTFMVVQGFFITLDKIGWWWRWLHWVGFHSYSFASFMTNEFEGASFACTQSSTLSFCEPGQESVPGDDVLTLYDIGAGVPGRDIWGNSGVLIAMTVLYRLIAAAWQWWFHVGKK